MPTGRAGYRSATKSRHLSPLTAWISSHVAYCGSHREHDDHDGVVVRCRGAWAAVWWPPAGAEAAAAAEASWSGFWSTAGMVDGGGARSSSPGSTATDLGATKRRSPPSDGGGGPRSGGVDDGKANTRRDGVGVVEEVDQGGSHLALSMAEDRGGG
ncbi:hypothetical protein [Oryza sativa Japonica Group]|uniref:Uncharacterized protein n=1 Tax=Oryza sativa subsp. japonica TaxID=39947 RepID=Q656H4_ORYSJ|nr:hypothetical protein [Oryza sativa Japonica Group]